MVMRELDVAPSRILTLKNRNSVGNFGLHGVPRRLTLNLTLKVNFKSQMDLRFVIRAGDLTL